MSEYGESAGRDEPHETLSQMDFVTRASDLAKSKPRRWPEMSARLLTGIFGRGDLPRVRMALYSRIVKSCQTYGHSAEKIVWRLIARSKNAKHRDRWFCSIIREELERADMLVPDELDDILR